jgi:hypothetical protein
VSGPFQLRRFRDLTLLVRESEALVIACDSLGGIGPHPRDAVRVEPEVVGYGLARVVLLELASVGADPLLVVDALSCAAEPHGARIAAGVARHLAEIGLDPALALTGSTEENMPIEITAAGIFALGRATLERLLIGGARAGDEVWLLGRPQVGSEVHFEHPALPSYADFRGLGQTAGVHELIPIGSGGIGAELRGLEQRCGLRFRATATSSVDFDRSAGPATAALWIKTPRGFETQATGGDARLERVSEPERLSRLSALLLGRMESRG